LVAGTDPDDGTILNEQLGSGEPGENIYTALFDLLSEPSGELVQGDDVVAVVLKRCWNDREPELTRLGQEQDVIFLNRILDRSAFLFPVWHQFIDATRIHDCAGDDVRTDLLSLLQNSNRGVFV